MVLMIALFQLLLQSPPSTNHVRELHPEAWIAEDLGAVPVSPLDDRSTPITLRVRGKRVTFGLKGAFSMSGKRGADGSILLTRYYRQISWTDESSIWYQGVEDPVPYKVEVYIDRQNHAGWAFDGPDTDPTQIPPRAFATLCGKTRKLGWGNVVHMGRSGSVVVLNRSATPTKASVHLAGSQLQLAADAFVGERRDGTLAFASREQIIEVRSGKVQRVRQLPVGWSVVAAAPGGWMLAARQAEGKSQLGILDERGFAPIRIEGYKDIESVLRSMDSATLGDRAFRVRLGGRSFRFSKRGR
jgi:hypothetical protein